MEAAAREAAEARIVVPLAPPSVNHYVRHTRAGRHYVTREAREFKRTVAVVSMGRRRLDGPYVIEALICLGKGVRDVDNCGKALLDSLADAGLIRNDAAVAKLTLEKARDWARPRTEILVRGFWPDA